MIRAAAAVPERKVETAMTMLFSIATPRLIVMTADGVELHEFEGYREYGCAKKYCCYEGVGCVTTWGARVGNNIERYLSGQRISPRDHSIDDLASLVMTYLTNEYSAHEPESDDIGYHVAGFDHSEHPRMYHILWGIPRPNIDHQPADYCLYDHSPSDEKPIQLLYNGRNDIAQRLVDDLLIDLRGGEDIGFDVNTTNGLAQLGYFVALCAAELTPEVGPPFTTLIVSPGNQIQWLTGESIDPPSEQRVRLAAERCRDAHMSRGSGSGSLVEVPPQSRTGPEEYAGGTITALPSFVDQPPDAGSGPG